MSLNVIFDNKHYSRKLYICSIKKTNYLFFILPKLLTFNHNREKFINTQHTCANNTIFFIF